MKRMLLATGLFIAVFVGLAAADDAAKVMKELEGNYSLKSLSKGGKPAPPQEMESFKEMTIKDGTITIKLKAREEEAKFKIDPAQKPPHIDITPTQGARKDLPLKGIYKFEMGTLTIVLAREGDRPKDFKEEPGSNIGTMVFQKKKSE